MLTREQFKKLPLDDLAIDRSMENRPYRDKLELVSRMIISKALYKQDSSPDLRSTSRAALGQACQGRIGFGVIANSKKQSLADGSGSEAFVSIRGIKAFTSWAAVAVAAAFSSQIVRSPVALHPE